MNTSNNPYIYNIKFIYIRIISSFRNLLRVNEFQTTLGNRVKNILKYLFPVPKEDSKRVISFCNRSDYISFRHHTYSKDGKDIELTEIGPRFEMKLYEVKMGTIENVDADTEWVLRPFMNTSKKRDFL